MSDAAKRAVFGTVRSAVVFSLQDYDDAKTMERRFAPLTAAELMRLPAYEIAAQLSESNAPARPVTGMTLPLPDAEREPVELACYSALRHGTARGEIEDALETRITPPQRGSGKSATGASFGRRKLGGAE